MQLFSQKQNGAQGSVYFIKNGSENEMMILKSVSSANAKFLFSGLSSCLLIVFTHDSSPKKSLTRTKKRLQCLKNCSRMKTKKLDCKVSFIQPVHEIYKAVN